MATSIYDMDRTITRAGTWEQWLRFWVRTQAPWRAILLPFVGLAAAFYALRLFGRGDLKALVHLLLMGRRVSRARVAAVAREFAQSIVRTGCFESALAQIATDRAGRRRLILATASNAYYAEAIGAALGFDMVVATPTAGDEEWISWRLGGANNYGFEKARRLKDIVCEGTRFYSDHHSDGPVFEMVVEKGGEAVAVNPTPTLRSLATMSGWDVVEWGKVEASWFERA